MHVYGLPLSSEGLRSVPAGWVVGWWLGTVRVVVAGG